MQNTTTESQGCLISSRLHPGGRGLGGGPSAAGARHVLLARPLCATPGSPLPPPAPSWSFSPPPPVWLCPHPFSFPSEQLLSVFPAW